MEWIYTIIVFILGLFTNQFLSKYTSEKGKNLATKEDIKKITELTESVKTNFDKKFEIFSLDRKYKYELYHKQYTELYSKLYVILIQSEYIRHFLELKRNEKLSFEEYPFFEIGPTKRVITHQRYSSDKVPEISSSTEIIETPISSANKKLLYELIIDNAEFATPRLLKLAVAYRFNHTHYGEASSSALNKIAKEEEFRLIKEMIYCIVEEYNYFREELKMPYNEEEKKNKIIKLDF